MCGGATSRHKQKHVAQEATVLQAHLMAEDGPEGFVFSFFNY